jgi:hypothetical protein
MVRSAEGASRTPQVGCSRLAPITCQSRVNPRLGGRPILRDASLRDAPQDEADESCGVWVPGQALEPVPGRREAPIRVRRPGMTKEHVVISGLDPSITTTSQALKTIIKIKYVLTLGNCRSF